MRNRHSKTRNAEFHTASDYFSKPAHSSLGETRLSRRRRGGGRWSRRAYAPHGVADVVRNQQRSCVIQGDADGPAAGLRIIGNEARHNVLGRAARAPVTERHEHHLVADRGIAVPAAMFADKTPLWYWAGRLFVWLNIMPSGATCDASE